ncbi:hypothetical protein [Rhodospira trueperi]|uniref:hypothetical protein n=1 Tax=Rhodospira trueperi TaxID=69960 RepID=UPI00159FB99F|nr:hypothetical protein [Rhodospira trueperi]
MTAIAFLSVMKAFGLVIAINALVGFLLRRFWMVVAWTPLAPSSSWWSTTSPAPKPG